ncbi:DNA-binding protein, partial [Clostridium paraputrificum]
MNNENTSIRLKQIMKERNLRQVDLLEMVKPFCEKYNVKINKSDISQYLSGKVKPGQEKLSMLGMALNINE